jgi:vacuolar-type H+-ATPase subunit E/Vma4
MTVALEELMAALERDAGAQIREILAAGEAEAAHVDAEAARARADRIATTIAASADERRIAGDLEVAVAARRGRADVLGARACMLERIREAIAGELPKLVADNPRLGASLVAAALSYVGAEPGVLRCPPALAEPARSTAPSGIDVVIDPAISTGAVVELATGTRVDATLVALLERAWPSLACEALAMERAR